MRYLLLLLAASGSMATTPGKGANFYARRDYLPQKGAWLVRAADINGDGIPDIVAPNTLENVQVNSLLGNGNGTFRTGPVSTIGFQYVGGMALLDLNSDGVVDLVVAGIAGNGSNGIGVCLGNGDGSFQAAVFYQAASDSGIDDLVVGDFNEDGIPDVATVGNSGVWLYTGKGGGVFNAGVVTPTPSGFGTGVAAGRMAMADFNGDGHLDLAVTFNNSQSGFAMLFGNGNGTFQPAVIHSVAPVGAEFYIAAGILRGDGHTDLVLSPTHVGVAYVNVLFNDGKGGSRLPRRFRWAARQTL